MAPRPLLGAVLLAGCVSSDVAPFYNIGGDHDGSGEEDSSGSSSAGDASDSTGEPADEAPLPEYDGDPLPDAPVGVWQWVDFPEASCRDGTPTGIGVRRGESDNLVVFFEGGGACFNGFTCLANPDHFDLDDFIAWVDPAGSRGLFDRDHPANPVADWSVVYVPYCSGDVHAGDNHGVTIVDAPGVQSFAGYTNVDAYLRRVVPTFGGAPEVLVTGVSAGGFGSGFNYHRLARVFSGKVTLLDDSGPVMRDDYLAPCLQAQWREVWNFDGTLPEACADCFAADGGGIWHIIEFLAARHPEQRMGFISSERDATISIFYGFGLDECAGLGAIYPGARFTAGLHDLRDHILRPAGNAGSYFIPGVEHTFIAGSRFYDTEVDGVRLTDWVADLLAGEVSHVSPPQ
ncbi:MAG: hypothetical protein JNL82_39960 [Myxococcales bacterium]|nr:hypothetical protein [Myxococcales bacterium]